MWQFPTVNGWEAVGACTHCTVTNHWHHPAHSLTWQGIPGAIYGQWWQHYSHTFPYIENDSSGNCHSACDIIQLGTLIFFFFWWASDVMDVHCGPFFFLNKGQKLSLHFYLHFTFFLWTVFCNKIQLPACVKSLAEYTLSRTVLIKDQAVSRIKRTRLYIYIYIRVAGLRMQGRSKIRI